MRNDSDIEEKLKKIRKQGRSQIIIMISSLLLVFLWFSAFSWVLDQPTFGQEVFHYMMSGFSPTYAIILIFIISMLFTIFYIYLIKRLAPSLASD